MSEAEYSELHQELGFSLSLYLSTHVESPLANHLTDETMIVFQTDDQDFNAHELETAKHCREKDDRPDRAATLIYVKVPSPPSVEQVDWDHAKVLSRLVIQTEPAKM